MINGLIALPVQVLRTVAAFPVRLESMERSMADMQRLLAAAVEQLKTIDDHTQAMRGQLGRIDDHTAELRGHAEGLGENTDRLVRIAAPLERVSQSRRARRERGRRAPQA